MSNQNFRACTPFYVLLDLSLSGNEMRLYGIIEQMESCTGTVFYSNRKLGEMLGVNPRSIPRMRSKLEKKGYLTRKETEVNTKNGQKIRHCWSTMKQEIVFEDESGGDAERHGGDDTQCHGGGDAGRHICNSHKVKSKTINKTPYSPPKGDSAPEEKNKTPKYVFELVDAWNELMPEKGYPSVKLNAGTVRKLTTRLKTIRRDFKETEDRELTPDDFKAMLNYLVENKYFFFNLKGNYVAKMEDFVKASNFSTALSECQTDDSAYLKKKVA